MSELRQNLLTGNWTVIAPERGEKPRGIGLQQKLEADPLPEHDPTCPFCPGNEERFPLEIIDEITDENGAWLTRTINNKYKLFGDFVTCPVNPEPFKKRGIYTYYEGCGSHFLVLEGRSHNTPLGAKSLEEIRSTLVSYQMACLTLKKNPNNLVTIMYKNQGARAGASQAHAHSQIVGSRIVPAFIRNAMHVQDKYFDDYGACALCTIAEHELTARERIVIETAHWIVLSPFAASTPYEIWIVAKRHFACYEEILVSEIEDLSIALKRVLGAYIAKLNNPDFNYFIHCAPHPMINVPFYHVHIQIMPRLSVPGGFETGTHIPVNTVWPENVPRLLIDVL
ncbi:MAG: hypothetical protein HYS23_12945 [Geobacter sp.]|nr:hypothetical protein [Geobacter sp.]